MPPARDAANAVPGAFHALPFAVGAQYDFQWPNALLWAAGIFAKAEDPYGSCLQEYFHQTMHGAVQLCVVLRAVCKALSIHCSPAGPGSSWCAAQPEKRTF